MANSQLPPGRLLYLTECMQVGSWIPCREFGQHRQRRDTITNKHWIGSHPSHEDEDVEITAAEKQVPVSIHWPSAYIQMEISWLVKYIGPRRMFELHDRLSPWFSIGGCLRRIARCCPDCIKWFARMPHGISVVSHHQFRCWNCTPFWVVEAAMLSRWITALQPTC